MEKGDKFTQQNKNTKPYYWFTHFKVYLCISGGYNYYLQWWTIFRQCQEQTLIQEVKNPMGKEKCRKKTLHRLYPAAKENGVSSLGSLWLTYSLCTATKKPPHSSYFSQILKQAIVQLPLNVGHPEKMLDYWGEASYNIPQWFSVGLLVTSGPWKPH